MSLLSSLQTSTQVALTTQKSFNQINHYSNEESAEGKIVVKCKYFNSKSTSMSVSLKKAHFSHLEFSKHYGAKLCPFVPTDVSRKVIE